MIRVLVAEDHTIVREGIKQLIGMARDLEVAGEASNGEQLLEVLRRTYCSTVGIRPSPGRVTRGTSNNLYSPQSVQGPMARNVADLALFLDSMAGFCPHDPMTFDAPAVSFSAALARPVAPKRVAFSIDFGGRFELDREIREILLSDEVKKAFQTQGMDPSYSTAPEFADLVRRDAQRWADLIRVQNIKADGPPCHDR